jgi:hypothetical protein
MLVNGCRYLFSAICSLVYFFGLYCFSVVFQVWLIRRSDVGRFGVGATLFSQEWKVNVQNSRVDFYMPYECFLLITIQISHTRTSFRHNFQDQSVTCIASTYMCIQYILDL